MTESGDETIRLGDRYELGGLLGRGGMADVRVGRDLRLGRTVAIKQLRGDLAADDTFQARFRREAQSSAALNHPSIVAVYDTGESIDKHGSHVPYIVMEYVEGQTLRDILRGAENGRKILPERALSITADILSALDYSHRSGIIHRDIKPANVMLTPSGQVKVMDFGIARAIADTSSAMTQTAAVIGTAQYLSPEQARGETVDARSDIYSTGCLLYELLTGRPPFVGDSPVSVAYQHVREEARPPSQLNPDVSQDIDHIVAKALAKRVEDRYESAADMRKDIERVLAGMPVDAPTSATAVVPGATAVAPAAAATTVGSRGSALPDPEDEPDGSGKWWAIGAVALVLIAAIAGVLWFTGAFDSDPDPVAQVTVPDVAGRSVDVATRALEREGLVVGDITEQASSEVDEGDVIETDPVAGDTVDKGSTVNLVTSKGPEQVEVPSLTGFSYDRAKELLRGLGLQPQKEMQDSSLPRDQVVNTDPPGGTAVPVGSTVKLFVSRGQVTVPDLVGQNIDDARRTLDDLGLKYRITEDPNAGEEAGRVTRQSPSSGQQVPMGSAIQLIVSTRSDTQNTPTTPTPPTTPTDPSTPDGDGQ
ncbi:Stk1 family PASTA domain-containing Ser/Thr kinase [Aeromicrobium wangtongii]|uniref:non-specific serine/threonine protein kinase n=1 Tax=Aeromicrobium wangtongii TaxID=2969247 RepID=A0ABY5MAI3_9ACTN|nr:Stk1 family PASTA domain-containing Ser/Thr kinase [Aeromicrobium wangtongii]MCD9199410.1 Stk1 family PASTA domain-containing Ser/Thr kinase [Aeromicrobium wangtongii]UUP13767.1 Stk1 family PASTA domain-containing Ser/Thr kinase [Aeromicrobium wangtongii]